MVRIKWWMVLTSAKQGEGALEEAHLPLAVGLHQSLQILFQSVTLILRSVSILEPAPPWSDIVAILHIPVSFSPFHRSVSNISQIYLKKASEFTDHDRLKKIISGLEIFRWLSEGSGGYCSDPDKISWVPWVAAWKRAGRLLLNLHLKSWPPAQYCSELGNCFSTWTLAEREYCRETIWVLFENLSNVWEFEYCLSNFEQLQRYSILEFFSRHTYISTHDR